MTFGLETTDLATSTVRIRGTENIRPFIETFKSYGHIEIDTARVYGNGETEQVCDNSLRKRVKDSFGTIILQLLLNLSI